MPKHQGDLTHRTLLELTEEDDAALGRLIKRFQQRLWETGGRDKVTKISVLRQLIRHMDKQKKLPPIKE